MDGTRAGASSYNGSEGGSWRFTELPGIDSMTEQELSPILCGLAADGVGRAKWGLRLEAERRNGRVHVLAECSGMSSVLLTVTLDSEGVHINRCRALGDKFKPADVPALVDQLLSDFWESAPALTVEAEPGDAVLDELQRVSGFKSVAARVGFSRPDHAGRDRACGAVVYRHTAEAGVEYLLIRQHDGAWGFPKGHMDPGEGERDTALREIAEETGIPVTIDSGFRELVTYVIPAGRRKWVTYFLARATAEAQVSRQAAEIAEFAWLPYSQARERVSFANTRELLERADRFRRLRGLRL